MGLYKKIQAEEGKESEDQNWVFAEISIRKTTSLKPISTKPLEKDGDDDYEEEEGFSTTPTSKESRIPLIVSCPPAPRKRRASRCHCNGAVEFFTPPDLESVFVRHVQRAD